MGFVILSQPLEILMLLLLRNGHFEHELNPSHQSIANPSTEKELIVVAAQQWHMAAPRWHEGMHFPDQP